MRTCTLLMGLFGVSLVGCSMENDPAVQACWFQYRVHYNASESDYYLERATKRPYTNPITGEHNLREGQPLYVIEIPARTGDDGQCVVWRDPNTGQWRQN